MKNFEFSSTPEPASVPLVTVTVIERAVNQQRKLLHQSTHRYRPPGRDCNVNFRLSPDDAGRSSGQLLGSIGVIAPSPSTCSMQRAPASSLASPRTGATTCSPTGR